MYFLYIICNNGTYGTSLIRVPLSAILFSLCAVNSKSVVVCLPTCLFDAYSAIAFDDESPCFLQSL